MTHRINIMWFLPFNHSIVLEGSDSLHHALQPASRLYAPSLSHRLAPTYATHPAQ